MLHQSRLDVTADLTYTWLFDLIEIVCLKEQNDGGTCLPEISIKTSHEINNFNTLKRKAANSGTASIDAKLIAKKSRGLKLQKADRKEYEHKIFATRQKNRNFKH